MSQRGAQQMANEGMGHTDILRFYYKDITFSTLSVSPPSLPSPSGAAPAAKSASYNSVRLTWKAVPGADGYRIYRKTSSASYKIVKDALRRRATKTAARVPGRLIITRSGPTRLGAPPASTAARRARRASGGARRADGFQGRLGLLQQRAAYVEGCAGSGRIQDTGKRLPLRTKS